MNLTLFNNKVLLLMIILVLNIFMLNNNNKELMLMLDITNKVLMIILLTMIMLNNLFDNKEVMDLSDFFNATSPYVVTRHIEGTRNVKYYQCCSEPYIDLNFR